MIRFDTSALLALSLLDVSRAVIAKYHLPSAVKVPPGPPPPMVKDVTPLTLIIIV
jgi:hypothetical protein